MLFHVLRSLVFGLLAVMMFPAIALATIGAPAVDSAPAVLAGWIVLGAVGIALAWVFTTDALLARRALAAEVAK